MWLSGLFLIFFSLSLMGNESKEPQAKEGEHGAKPAEQLVETQHYSGQQDNSWMSLQTELAALKNKIDTDKKAIDEALILKKHATPHAVAMDPVQFKKKHEEFLETVKKYNSKLREFETKYPEKGIELGRIYKRKPIQSVEQMESQLTMDGRIQKINKKIKAQFGHSVGDKTKSDKLEKPTVEEPYKEKENPKVDVTDQLRIVK